MTWHSASRPNKILFWSLVVLAIAMVLAVAFAIRGFNREVAKEDIPQKTEQQNQEKDPTQLSFCDDRTGESRKDCESAVRDGQIYDQALKQFNPSLCAEIRKVELQGICKESVISGQEYVKKNDPEGYGRILLRGTNVEQGVNAYEAFIKERGVENVSVDALIDLALGYGNLALRQYENRSALLKKAKALLETAKKRDPDNVRVPLTYAYIGEVENDLFAALAFYEQVLAKDSSNKDALIGRGHVSSMMGMIDLAIADFKKAEELDVEHINSRIPSNLCRILSGETEKYAEALLYCEKVLRVPNVNPIDASQAHAIMANIALQRGDRDRSRLHLFQAETLYPNDPNVKVMLAQFFRSGEDFEQAVRYAGEAIAIDSKKTAAYQERVSALYQLGRYEEAIRDAEMGLKVITEDVSLLEPNKPAEKRALLYTLADIYGVQGNTAREAEMRKQGDAVFAAPKN